MKLSTPNAKLQSLGPRPWLVLGGGGLKGLGHLGAWRALHEVDFRPAGILGTSIGALAGALIAGGRWGPDLERKAVSLRKEDILHLRRRVAFINGIRTDSVFHGPALAAYVTDLLDGLEWGDLGIPFQVNGTSLGLGTSVWFGPGARTDFSLGEAVTVSASVPVIFPPVPDGDDFLVDGGVTDALALNRAVELGCTGLVAVDVGAGQEDEPGPIVEQGLVAIHQRVFSIQAGNRRREQVANWSGPPLLFVRPRLEGYSTFDFGSLDYFLKEGYRATREALED